MSLDKSITWYLAGPMRGLPKLNYPQFIEAAKVLREWGYTIVSPAEIDSPTIQADALTCVAGEDRATYGGETPGQILARDVVIVSDQVGGVIFLPNWWHSRGAKLEAHVALDNGKEFGFFQPKGSWSPNWDGLSPVNELHKLKADQIRNVLSRFI
jgi:Domain of unknown function (DUF4406)